MKLRLIYFILRRLQNNVLIIILKIIILKTTQIEIYQSKLYFRVNFILTYIYNERKVFYIIYYDCHHAQTRHCSTTNTKNMPYLS